MKVKNLKEILADADKNIGAEVTLEGLDKKPSQAEDVRLYRLL